MHTIPSKYRFALLAVLLAPYLAGLLGEPVMESLHLIAHRTSKILSPADHQHGPGQQHDHHHPVLETLQELLSLHTQDETPAEKQKAPKKKNPERPASQFSFFRFEEMLRPGYCPAPPVRFSIFPSVPTPPPRSQEDSPGLIPQAPLTTS